MYLILYDIHVLSIEIFYSEIFLTLHLLTPFTWNSSKFFMWRSRAFNIKHVNFTWNSCEFHVKFMWISHETCKPEFHVIFTWNLHRFHVKIMWISCEIYMNFKRIWRVIYMWISQALISLGGLILYIIERWRTHFTLYTFIYWIKINQLINFQKYFFALFNPHFCQISS
jgi:hypothetical protein